MGKLTVTYDPVRSLKARKEQILKPTEIIAYSHLIYALKGKGMQLDLFKGIDFDFLANEDDEAIFQFLEQRFADSDFVIHHYGEFDANLLHYTVHHNADNFFQRAFETVQQGTTSVESLVNRFLYENMPEKSHGLHVPHAYNPENIRRKDRLPSIARKLGVPTPRTVVPASAFKGEFYPAFLKHKASKCGRDVHMTPNPDVFEEYRQAANLDDYVMQQAVDIPTEAASAFRVVYFRRQALGIVLYFGTDKYVSNRSAKAYSLYLPGFPDNFSPDVSPFDGIVASAYESMGLINIVTAILDSGQKVADFCASKGCQKTGLDFVVDRNRNHYLLDVNRDPGTGFYRIQFGELFPSLKTGTEVAAQIDSALLSAELND